MSMCGFFIVYCGNCVPEFVCVASVVPVFCKMFLPELLFTLLYPFVNFVVEWCELRVSMVLFPDSVSVVYGCYYVFWKEFMFDAHFTKSYIVLVGRKYSIR